MEKYFPQNRHAPTGGELFSGRNPHSRVFSAASLLAHNFSAAYNAKYGMGPAGTMLIARRKSLQLPFSVIESVSFLPKSKDEEKRKKQKKGAAERACAFREARKGDRLYKRNASVRYGFYPVEERGRIFYFTA